MFSLAYSAYSVNVVIMSIGNRNSRPCPIITANLKDYKDEFRLCLATLNKMADESKSKSSTQCDQGADRNLEEFILDHYQQEKNAGRLIASDKLNEKRIDDFYNRAIAESRRMNEEVVKSKQQQLQLHQELGAKNLAEWRQEHASQTLLPEQAERVRLADQYC
ncbi:uncharacterized protein LOC124115105 [Haliotis rufescens]|uniref:uncharacterized protein LOC124115105 n=1 Tax=Haliotis rufescens TaxID=6454 RepID=UPI001EB06E1B|nr:uncharacterized protein LOC124115105 [Haliotis rufescens]